MSEPVDTVSSLLNTDRFSLVPANLKNPDEYAEFKQQRIVCGWEFSDEALQQMMDKQEKKLKSLFWITIPNIKDTSDTKEDDQRVSDSSNGVTDPSSASSCESAPALAHNYSPRIRAGHISLDSYAEPPDPELAREDRSIMTVQTFFIRPEYRLSGLGRGAMEVMERLAIREPYGSPQCHTLALNTASKRYVEVDAPEWRGMWERLGMVPPTYSNETWYEKLGYVYWKDEPRHAVESLDGHQIMIIASFMRKRLKP